MSLFKNNWNQILQIIYLKNCASQLTIGIICGIVMCKLWSYNYTNKKSIGSNEQNKPEYEITKFSNIFGSNVYTPCKCGFPHQVCDECKDSKLEIEFPANVLLFSKSINNEIPNGGILFSFNTPLTSDTIDEVALQLDVSIPIQYGTVMIHYMTNQNIELLWCANTSEEAKHLFPVIELLSRIVQICECSQALGYNYKPITSMIIHDIDVYL